MKYGLQKPLPTKQTIAAFSPRFEAIPNKAAALLKKEFIVINMAGREDID